MRSEGETAIRSMVTVSGSSFRVNPPAGRAVGGEVATVVGGGGPPAAGLAAQGTAPRATN